MRRANYFLNFDAEFNSLHSKQWNIIQSSNAEIIGGKAIADCFSFQLNKCSSIGNKKFAVVKLM